ncbi:ribonuclease P 40kDa subunit-domain-containing protein [Daedaleopsis nitida]|nr:ribonuclease P 40kDa subunit-domain-containing protein [Daedaleopsis nitida]
MASESIRTIVASGTSTPRVDVIFPANASLQTALQSLQLTYHKCESSLSDFLRFAKPHINQLAAESKVVALGLAGPADDDVWSLDSSGVLTIASCKQTYESLGLPGERLPWKECQDTHGAYLPPFVESHLLRAPSVRAVIHISVRDARPNTAKWLTYGAKETTALHAWDARRGPWKIAYHLQDPGSDLPVNSVEHRLERSERTRANVHIPVLKPSDLVLAGSEKEDVEEWEEKVSSLFEWVGMASLGSQRLSGADRCDPYISVYTPPEPSSVGELTVMRWRGLIPSSFVQDLMDTILSPNMPYPGFVSVTAHSVPTSPVTYIPVEGVKAPPLRASRLESEDTWTLVYSREGVADSPQGGCWVLGESVGRWDRRWG